MAIGREYQGYRLGEVLLFNALRPAYDAGTEHIAAVAVSVDALLNIARASSERYGFRRFPDIAQRLFCPVPRIAPRLAEDH